MPDNFIGTAKAAELLNTTPKTIWQHCQDYNIGIRIGAKKTIALSKEDVECLSKIVRDGPGNPGFVEGNRFGVPPKRRRKK